MFNAISLVLLLVFGIGLFGGGEAKASIAQLLSKDAPESCFAQCGPEVEAIDHSMGASESTLALST